MHRITQRGRKICRYNTGCSIYNNCTVNSSVCALCFVSLCASRPFTGSSTDSSGSRSIIHNLKFR